MGLNRKGVSPVIATVSLIAMAMVLASILYVWATGFIGEQIEKNGKSTEQVCKEVSFEVDYDLASGGLELQAVNTGNIPIYDFDIKFVEPRSSSVKHFNMSADVASASERKFVPLSANVNKIIVYPIILGKVRQKEFNKATSCFDNGQVIAL